MNEVRCPQCRIKLPLLIPEGFDGSFLVWCRSRTCHGKWVNIDRRAPALVH
jgi:hypothetical protein